MSKWLFGLIAVLVCFGLKRAWDASKIGHDDFGMGVMFCGYGICVLTVGVVAVLLVLLLKAWGWIS